MGGVDGRGRSEGEGSKTFATLLMAAKKSLPGELPLADNLWPGELLKAAPMTDRCGCRRSILSNFAAIMPASVFGTWRSAITSKVLPS